MAAVAAASRAQDALVAADKASAGERWSDVIRHIDAALATSRTADTSNAHHSRGIALLRLNRFNEAKDALDRAVELNDRNANALVNRGV
jgi:predicted RNA polymerase sigma factor